MAIKLDQNLINELGLGNLPDSEKSLLLNHIYETLEMRVGMRLAELMSNEQLDEFEKYFQAKDDNGAFNWLETNFPSYKEIVQDEFDKLKEEVRLSAPTIMAVSTQQPQPASDPGQPSEQQGQTPPTPLNNQPYQQTPQVAPDPSEDVNFQQPYQQQPPTFPSDQTPS